jgi:hypothetical protein
MSMSQSPSLERRSDLADSEVARLEDELIALRQQLARVKCASSWDPPAPLFIAVWLACEVAGALLTVLMLMNPSWGKAIALACLAGFFGLLLMRQRAEDIAAVIADREIRLAALKGTR